MQSLDDHRAGAAGKPDGVAHRGDGADGGELILMARHEEHALFVGRVNCQRDGHAGEDDRIIKRD